MEKKRRRRTKHKRKRTSADDGDMSMDTTSNSCDNDSSEETDMCHDSVKSTCHGSHSAGHDAFMTGFTFAYYVSKYTKCRSQSDTVSFCDLDCSDIVNRVCLTGKNIPLQIVKSNFAKTSKNHREKLEWLKLAMA